MASAALPESSTTPEARAIFEDAAAAHRVALPLSDGAASYHEEPAATIELILEGGNSMRRARDPARRPVGTNPPQDRSDVRFPRPRNVDGWPLPVVALR